MRAQAQGGRRLTRGLRLGSLAHCRRQLLCKLLGLNRRIARQSTYICGKVTGWSGQRERLKLKLEYLPIHDRGCELGQGRTECGSAPAPLPPPGWDRLHARADGEGVALGGALGRPRGALGASRAAWAPATGGDGAGRRRPLRLGCAAPAPAAAPTRILLLIFIVTVLLLGPGKR